MVKRFSTLIILIWICNIGFSQDFKFKWQVWPSVGKAYTVLIEKRDAKSYIVTKETGANDSIRKKISQTDCDSLISFLNKYDFPTKGNTIYGPIVREYYETRFLADTNRIQINGDIVRRESIQSSGYYFDQDSNKYYTESQNINTWTDGNTYKGEYTKSNIKRTFSVYCVRIAPLDFKLINIIYNLIIKYDSKKDYKQLKKMIDSDKPRDKN